MKKFTFNHLIILILLFISLIFFSLQQFIFHNLHESGFLLFQDLIFMPIEILLVTFILDKILRDREKKERLQHQNIVINSFFSEIGTDTIRLLNKDIVNIKELSILLCMDQNWDNVKFDNVFKTLSSICYQFNITPDSLKTIKAALSEKKTYVISFFSNPNLLEIDSFTNMLWAFYHLIDELEHRTEIYELPDSDIEHLKNDIIRIYGMLVCQWIIYMKNLKDKYPYLWSLALRVNPFSENNDVIIKQR
ncbi:MAG: hypothetical protein GYA50_00760 [Eubacteriaceae bacterium]|nr:hypothetical protein [Eubacteriaceae bacterium]